MDEQPWTVAEVAKYLRIDRESVYRLCLRGKIVAYKPAGQWRIWKRDVLAYLESKRHRPANVQAARSAGPSARTLATLARFGITV